MDARAIVLRFDPDDVVVRDDEGPAGIAHDELTGCRRRGAGRGQQLREPARQRREGAFAQALAGAAEDDREPLVRERFQEIVERELFEGLQRVAIECGDEDHHWHRARLEPPQYFEAVDLWHLDVEKQDVGLMPADGLDRLCAVTALRDDLEIILPRQQQPDRLPRQRLIVYHHGTPRPTSAGRGRCVRAVGRFERHASGRASPRGGASVNGVYGSVTVARTPPPSRGAMSRAAAPPNSAASRDARLRRPVPVASLNRQPGGRPTPVSSTAMRIRPLSRMARTCTEPSRTRGASPWRTAFSTSGWTTSRGTRASAASGARSTVTFRRSAKRTRWMSR